MPYWYCMQSMLRHQTRIVKRMDLNNLVCLTSYVIIATTFGLVRSAEVTGTEDRNAKLLDGAYKVYRIYPNNTDQLHFLQTLWKSASKMQLNFWKDPSRVGVTSDVMVPPTVQESLEKLLTSNKINYFVTIQDVQKLIVERERHQFDGWHKDILADDLATRFRNAPSFDFRRYHSYEEMRIFMRSLERQNPKIAKVYTLGFSHENRPIEMIKISDPIIAGSKKAIWIDAGMHAREWASHSTAIYFMHQLVTKYEKDPVITQYVSNLTWYIAPCVNPDGYEYTRSSREPEVRMWRKNRSPNSDKCADTGRCCMGVDLNRNFDFHWSETGASDNPCEEIYQGSHAFSEPESRAIRDFILSHRNEIEAVITMHTYSQLWIHPFGHQRSIYPPDVDDLKDTADKATKALEKMYGTKYRVGSGADTLYPASGGSDDWAKAKAGVKYVYLLELRPEEDIYDGFVLDTNQLIPTGRETWEGVKIVTNTVLVKNGFPLVRSNKRNSGERFRQKDFTPAASTIIESTATTTTEAIITAKITSTAATSTPITITTARGALNSFSDSNDENTIDLSSSFSSSSPQALLLTANNLQLPSFHELFQTPEVSQSISSFSFTTYYPVVEQPELTNCLDFAGEYYCRRWVTNRLGICQRISDYMNRNCARTCGFCSST